MGTCSKVLWEYGSSPEKVREKMGTSRAQDYSLLSEHTSTVMVTTVTTGIFPFPLFHFLFVVLFHQVPLGDCMEEISMKWTH